jgi:hypothetical protein
MPDNFTIYEGEPAPVFASEDQNKRLLNVVGDDLYYRTDPGVSSSDTKLAPGEAAVITERVWIITGGQAKVIVESATAAG